MADAAPAEGAPPAQASKNAPDNMTTAEKQAKVAQLKKDNLQTLDRIVGTLEETNKSADDTLSKMEKNTAAMKRILDKQDAVKENLAQVHLFFWRGTIRYCCSQDL